ncbi:MAG: InlB B-repeat-containing protein, partial [Mogibacterium sp.]|nr:InlB B-repeat-containing protein [Mogibacterium sp.]
IGITTSDNGNWLRLPADKKYYIDINVSKETTLDLKMAEWQVYDGKEVRTETKDSKYNWTGLKMKPGKKVRWVFEAVPAGSDGSYPIASKADYYIEFMYTLTFELNGGTMWDETGTVTADYAGGTVINMPEPERDGYTFKYWKGSKYEAGDEYTVNEDHTFSAVWEKDKASGSDKDKSKGADTGDSTKILSWTALFMASLLGCLITLIKRRKRSL